MYLKIRGETPKASQETKNKNMKRRGERDEIDSSSEKEEQQSAKEPFWNVDCTKLSKRLPFGVRGTVIKTSEKEWDPSSKKLARRSWFACNIYKLDTCGKYSAGDWSCPTWKQVTQGIKLVEKEEEKQKRKEMASPQKKQRKTRNKTPKKDIGACRKIRLFPNEEERRVLNQ